MGHCTDAAHLFYLWLNDNVSRHEQSIVDALAALARKWSKIRFPGLYAQQVVDIQSGNYYAHDPQAQVKKEVKEIKQGTAKLSYMMGFTIKRTPQPTPEIDTPEKRNRIQNALLDRFG